MELIKFSKVKGEEAPDLLRFIATKYDLKADLNDPLIYCNDFLILDWRLGSFRG